MRFTIAAAVLLGAALLSGCGEQKTAETKMAYDLSAASNRQYLSDNGARDGVKTTPSGLQYRVIKSGSGKTVTSGVDLVTVTYKGWLIDGKVFDQTAPGDTAQFPAGRLIPGWVEALRLMKEGDEWEITIPAQLAYGERGAGADIPPGQVLVFDMALIKVTPQQAP